MSKDKVTLEESVAASLKQFHGESQAQDAEEKFLVLGYSTPTTLSVVDSGVGGLDAVKQHFIADDSRYILLRKVLKVELATTIKFVYIDWTPDTVKPMRKALLSTHKGQVQDYLKPYHVSFQISQDDEISEQMITNKISDSAGTSVHVTDKAEQKFAQKSGFKSGPALIPASVQGESSVGFEDEEAIRSAIRDIRKDADETNWCLIGYKNVNTLTLVGRGSGGIEELASKLNKNEVFYAFFRTTETVDKSVTVKFGFLKLLSDQVRPVERARIATHMGFVHKLFQPFHAEFLLDNPDDFTLVAVTQKFRDSLFLDSRVRDEAKSPPPSQRKMTAHSGPKVPVQGTTEAIKFSDEEEFKKVLAEIHNSQSSTTWMVASYAAKHTLSVIGSGSGDVSEVLDKFEDENVNFGLLRVVEVIDKSQTIKFVYIKWQPDSISPMKKAEIGVKKGAIDDLFRPYHVDFFISTKAELNQQIVMDRVAAVSGSKSNVVDK